MAERGTRTRIIFGGVSAEVSLLKTSGKPSEAKHETRRVLVDAPPAAPQTPEDPFGSASAPPWQDPPPATEPWQAPAAPAAPVGVATGPSETKTLVNPETGEEEQAEVVEVDLRGTGDLGEWRPFAGQPDPAPIAPPTQAAPAPDPEPEVYVPPETEVQQGVYLEDGTFVNLTDQLAMIDERTKLDGMEVLGCIPAMAVPRTRVRDASYVAAVAKRDRKVLRLIYDALKSEHAAAVVRWAPRSSESLGVLVATGTREKPVLALLHVEFAENMREPSERVLSSLDVEVSEVEQASASRLVRAWAMPTLALDDIRDQRLSKRTEVLQAARLGTLDDYEPPPERPAAETQPDLVAMLDAAAQR